MTHDVFLSYSRKDIKKLRRVRDTLTNAGLIVWTDEKLQPGTPSWKDAIEEALEHAKTVVVLMSPDAKKSVWVDRELEYANKRNIPIFPILVRGDERSAIPFELASTQYVDIRKQFIKGMKPLVSRLCDRLGIRDTSSRVSRPSTISIRSMNRSGLLVRFMRVGALAMILLLISAMGLLALEANSSDIGFIPTGNDGVGNLDVEPMARESALVLIYDALSLTLYNQSNAIVDTNNLHFISVSDNNVLYSSDEWVNDGTLTASQCVQVWSLGTGYPSPPENCESRRAWRQIAPARVFWQSQSAETYFEVHYGDALIATCETAMVNSSEVVMCPLVIE